MHEFEKHRNAVDILTAHASARGERTALVRYGGEESAPVGYAELLREAEGVAALLRERYAPGSRVLLMNSDPGDFVTSFLGCLLAGVIAVPSPLPAGAHHKRRLQRIAADAGAAAALSTDPDLAAIRDWVGEFALDLPVLDAADAGELAGSTTSASPHEIAFLQYTSGSTGSPKGVVVTHRDLINNIGSLCRGFGLDESVRFGGWVPLYHDMGLIAQLLPALFLGSSCALLPQAAFLHQPLRWLRMLDVCEVNYSAAPDFAFDFCVRLARSRDLSDLDLSRWTHAVNGSEPIRYDTLSRFAERFAETGFRIESFLPSYGLAEATVYVSGGGTPGPVPLRVDAEALSRNAFRPAGAASRGTVLTGSGVPAELEVRVVDPASQVPAPPGVIGELWLRGESVASGYWENEAATKAVFHAETADGAGPYLRTGDLGVVHDGVVFVTGRLKDVLVVRGRNLYPQDIEEELRQQHTVLAAAPGVAFSVPVPDADDDQAAAMVVAFEPRVPLSPEECARLAEDMRLTVTREFGVSPGGIAFLPRRTVRRTTSGKTERSELRQRFLSGQLATLYEDLDAPVADARTGAGR
ncbi:fatty acyl-AMP ligase [Streptomyces marincola]|uniref:fatty acyl-AMP ligase n=1 Tax=Streptomyces marincola TaxID=2878388 RepID=UPI00131DE7EB|nr:fatty acyl-AMP ligase [Streptomyces marincola]